mmetsp:Transcript_43356/g.31665  ORF Transcript_43356/g.31665 Transcript_43356/m.31665 type:complete len:90 (+) Transcript_43356:251-520(+)
MMEEDLSEVQKTQVSKLRILPNFLVRIYFSLPATPYTARMSAFKFLEIEMDQTQTVGDIITSAITQFNDDHLDTSKYRFTLQTEDMQVY